MVYDGVGDHDGNLKWDRVRRYACRCREGTKRALVFGSCSHRFDWMLVKYGLSAATGSKGIGQLTLSIGTVDGCITWAEVLSGCVKVAKIIYFLR